MMASHGGHRFLPLVSRSLTRMVSEAIKGWLAERWVFYQGGGFQDESHATPPSVLTSSGTQAIAGIGLLAADQPAIKHHGCANG